MTNTLVQSYDEWSPLEEIIVGRVEGARIPIRDRPFLQLEAIANTELSTKKGSSFPLQVIEETKEDLAILVQTLEKLNITVHRPSTIDTEKVVKTLHWETTGRHVYCPRDVLLVHGNMIIETPMVFRSRQHEVVGYKPLLLHYLESGAKWLSAPKPNLLDDMYLLESDTEIKLNNKEPAFDAANILRAGRDLFYLVSNSGNELGVKWLRTILGKKFRVHECHNLYSGIHLDSTITLLRPGLALINPEQVHNSNLPPLLKNWQLLKCPQLVDIGSVFTTPISSIWIGMNLLMVTPELAIVDKNQVALIRLLEKHKIDTIPLALRHARTLGGGFHCVTLDIRRRGKCNDYF